MSEYEAQTRVILRMLRERDITALDALREAGVFRLAARIADLRADGHAIETEMIRTDSGKRVARYRLVGPMTLW